MEFTLYASCAKNLEALLAAEMEALGLRRLRLAPAGVWLSATLEQTYRACLWSRIANRIVLHLATLPADSGEALREAVRATPWEDLMASSARFRVAFSGNNPAIRNTAFGAQLVKDGVVDRARQVSGSRPDVDLVNPEIWVTVHLNGDRADLGLDLGGGSLHRRGYRSEQGAAPLKETLAAALLLRSGWPDIAAAQGDFVDPLCGSGTLVIEAALLARDRAPALFRERFGFSHWLGHDENLWQSVHREALDRAEAGAASCKSRFWGFDQDPAVIAVAWRNIERAGLAGVVHVERQALSELHRPSQSQRGLILTNPPYGERLSDPSALEPLYLELGERVCAEFTGWRLGVFTGMPEMGHRLGLRSDRRYKMFNGRIPAQLLLFDITEENRVSPRFSDGGAAVPRIANPERAAMFANRLRKNLKQLGSWARRNQVECFRLYDADMPEYAMAIDLYGDWVHVQEYAAPRTVSSRNARERLAEALAVIPEVLDVTRERIVCKQRQRQSGTRQYERLAQSGHWLTVREGNCRLRVNLKDYLDTGLFLDHRPIRQWIEQRAGDKRFLNLFAYTGAATVHAGMGGATRSLSVDLSNTYLDWLVENLRINGLDTGQHSVLRADCLEWLKKKPKEMFDLIFLDPPTFSNSSRMEDVLDVQRDQVPLIEGAMARLSAEGTLIFSTNFRRFSLAEEIAADYQVEDITRRTIDRDFARNPKIHQCWLIRHAVSPSEGR